MKRPAAFLLMALVPYGCQTESNPGRGEQSALQNPEIAAAIASDLSQNLTSFLPQGSVLSFKADTTERLSGAFSDALARAGYRLEGDGETHGQTIVLEVWSMEVDGDLLVRVSTLSHRLSKVYRQNRDLGADINSRVVPAGPLLVETIGKGAAS